MQLLDTCGEPCRDTLITITPNEVTIHWPGRRVQCRLTLAELEELASDIKRCQWEGRTAVIAADQMVRYSADGEHD